MSELNIRDFGKVITKLIQKQNLSREEAFEAFSVVLKNETSDIQQGAFLAALSAKGEIKEEIAGCWEAIYQFDTVKVNPKVDGPIVENSGTGMDTFKTFNISTVASLVAATEGIYMARHGARALTSVCGTVDMAEALGVDVECGAEIAAKSLESTHLALFNGMSPTIHPMALGRILSQMAFGSTLNIAASLASPVKADVGVRGVFSKDMLTPVVETMKEIGYKKALVFNGGINGQHLSMDEASVAGPTFCTELQEDGTIRKYAFNPEDVGIATQDPQGLTPSQNIVEESGNVLSLISGSVQNARFDAVAVNAGMIFYASGKSNTIKDGVKMASEILRSGEVQNTLTKWVEAQNRDPKTGLLKLNSLRRN